MDEDNELIAVFMGLVKHPADKTYNQPQWREPESDKRKKGLFVAYTWQLRYSESWDRLMPVAEKIADLFNQYPIVDWQNDRAVDQFMDVLGTPVATKIEDVHARVVEFIKWYNAQPK